MLFAPARGEREFYIVPLPGISASNSGSGSAFLQCIFNSIMTTQREVGDSGLIFSRRFCYSHRKNILTKWSGKLDFLMEFSFPLIPRNSTFPFPIVWNAILNSSFQLSGIGWVIPFPWIQKIIPAHPWFAHPLEVAIEQSSPSTQLVTLWIYWNLWPILPFFHYPRIDIGVDEVGMVGKPADGKDWDHQTKHLDYLKDFDWIQHLGV